jgi:hypothetical protein
MESKIGPLAQRERLVALTSQGLSGALRHQSQA